jgi:ABC-type nitrate/sulfonate/bicarbonate transport system permease component
VPGALRAALTAAILVVIWAAAADVADSALFPGPVEVARALAAALAQGTLVRAILVSAARLLAGYAAALAIGVPLGLVLARGPLA